MISDVLDVFRPKRWYRNLSMVIGIFIALKVLEIPLNTILVDHLLSMELALIGLCLVASGNYGINEILDADSDAHHPQKNIAPFHQGASPNEPYSF